MSRLKDADAIVKRLKDFFCKNCNNYNGVKCRACEMDDALSAIDEAPTVDAEPVVRCEKCKYSCREIFLNGSELYLCTRIGKDSFVLLNEGDKYCAYGERRESE